VEDLLELEVAVGVVHPVSTRVQEEVVVGEVESLSGEGVMMKTMMGGGSQDGDEGTKRERKLECFVVPLAVRDA
jgi:hypothetical protein